MATSKREEYQNIYTSLHKILLKYENYEFKFSPTGEDVVRQLNPQGVAFDILLVIASKRRATCFYGYENQSDDQVGADGQPPIPNQEIMRVTSALGRELQKLINRTFNLKDIVVKVSKYDIWIYHKLFEKDVKGKDIVTYINIDFPFAIESGDEYNSFSYNGEYFLVFNFNLTTEIRKQMIKTYQEYKCIAEMLGGKLVIETSLDRE